MGVWLWIDQGIVEVGYEVDEWIEYGDQLDEEEEGTVGGSQSKDEQGIGRIEGFD